jgi:hypothetical protein
MQPVLLLAVLGPPSAERAALLRALRGGPPPGDAAARGLWLSEAPGLRTADGRTVLLLEGDASAPPPGAPPAAYDAQARAAAAAPAALAQRWERRC